jgi:methylglyoxal synthase
MRLKQEFDSVVRSARCEPLRLPGMLFAMDRVVALIAHDGRKPDMVAFAMFNRSTLEKWTIVATDSTGRLLEQKVGLRVERVLSGVEGGDLQIAARVATRHIDAVIFLVDPFDRHAHEPDIQGLQRVCQVHDVPLATNMATANLMLEALSFGDLERAGSRP